MNLAVIAALLLLFPVGLLVPSLMTGTESPSQETVLEPVGTTDRELEQKDVELDTMHFSPSASNEDGIYYVARRGVDAIAYFGKSEVWYVVGNTLVRLQFPGSMRIIPVGEETTGSVTNYMFGNDPSRWKNGLTDCAVLRYEEIYSGIDLVYRFLDGNLKYEFVVAPHADPGMIQMRYPDADIVEVQEDSLTVSKNGFKVVDTGLTALEKGLGDGDVECTFRSRDTSTIAFSMGRYDASCELIVDPIVLVYSSFLGGGTLDDVGYGIAVENGSIYVTGYTESTGFPTVNAYDSTFNGVGDCFVTKLAVDGQSLVYSTFLGGTALDRGQDIAVENGFAYVTGFTESAGFPTVNAYDSTFNGVGDCFVTKLAVDGQSLLYSTFLGGTALDRGQGIAVENGSIYVTGYAESTGFPTANAYDSTHNGLADCFVTKLAVDGQSLVYSTFLGGTDYDRGEGIAVEGGFVYVTGETYSSGFPTVSAFDSTYNGNSDCFVTELAVDSQSLVYSTFLGGSSPDYGYGIAVEGGFAYVTGQTSSSDFPVVSAYDGGPNGGYDCFVTKLAVNGQFLVYSTFFGGTGGDRAYGIAVEDGFAYVTGQTSSSDFPTVNAVDSVYSVNDCFVTMLAVDGQSLVYSTFLGGSDEDYGAGIAAEEGSAYIAGYTRSADFPTVTAYDWSHDGSRDCFIAVISGAIDTDMDGLSDRDEAYYGTNRFCIDSDNDNFLDGYEVAYGSDPTDPMSYPGMPQTWYDIIYKDLDGNTTLIQQVISWLDGNHTAIETLFFCLEGNATLLIQTVNAVNANTDQLDLLAALVTQNTERLTSLNATHIGDMAQIRAILSMLGVTVGDTDYDGLDDLDEIAHGTDIQCMDTDCDNLNDAYEVKIGTDPTDDDSDNDTYLDGQEVMAGTDPLDSLDYPGRTGTPTDPTMGIVLTIVTGGVGFAAIIALLVVMRRRAGAGSHS